MPHIILLKDQIKVQQLPHQKKNSQSLSNITDYIIDLRKNCDCSTSVYTSMSSVDNQLRRSVPANSETQHTFTESVTIMTNHGDKFCGRNYLQVIVTDSNVNQNQPSKYV